MNFLKIFAENLARRKSGIRCVVQTVDVVESVLLPVINFKSHVDTVMQPLTILVKCQSIPYLQSMIRRNTFAELRCSKHVQKKIYAVNAHCGGY